MTTYAFIVTSHSKKGADDSDREPNFVYCDSSPEPMEILERLINDELYDEPDQAGRWATLDRKVTVERHVWLPLGSLPEDRLGFGVAVVA